MKVGDEIDFYLFGNPQKGKIYEITKGKDSTGKTIQLIGIEHGGRYPGEWGVGEFRPYRYLARTYVKLPKKGKDRPPWYILSKNSQIRKKNERKNLK